MIHIHKNPIIQHAIPQQLSAPKDRTLAVHQAFFDQLNGLAGTVKSRLQGHCLFGGLSGVDEDRIRTLIGSFSSVNTDARDCLRQYAQELEDHLSHNTCGREHSGRILSLLWKQLKPNRNDTFNRNATFNLSLCNRVVNVNNVPSVNNAPGVNNARGINNVPGVNNVPGISNVSLPVRQPRAVAEDNTLVLKDNRPSEKNAEGVDSSSNESVDGLMNHQGSS